MNKSEKHFIVNSFLKLTMIVLLLFTASCAGKKGSPTVMTGLFVQSVTEPGELEAVRASNIIMPQISWQYGYQFKLIGLAEHGKSVHKGDSIIKLDPSQVYKYILDSEDKLENELAAANKQAVQTANNLQELNAQLKNEQASYDLKKLEVERSRFDTEVKKRIKELEFKQAEIKLKKVKRNLVSKPVIDKYDQRIQEIRVIQRKSDLKNAKETLKKFLIRAPLDGTFQVAKNQFTQNPQIFRLGDSPYIGQIIASIPDLRNMRARTIINETDIKKIRPGMKVIVRLDALPSVPFDGVITDISKICLPRDREKVFSVVVAISGSDPRLKPGMTVNCEYILYETKDEMFVPNNCLLRENNLSYIFLRKGKSGKKIEVSTGASNSNYTIIRASVSPGQKLVPFENLLSESKI